MIARIFLSVSSAVQLRLPWLHPYWSGICLGLLSEEVLAAVDQAVYDTRRSYRDRDHNQRGLFPWEEEAMRLYFGGCKRIMVLAAGGGREVIALRRRGIEAEGWECNDRLLTSGRKLLSDLGMPPVLHPMRRNVAPEGTGPWDGVILGWSMYMLVPGRQRRVQLLSDLRSRLPSGGPILLSFFTRADPERRALRVQRIAAHLRHAIGRPPPELGDDIAPNYIHRFARDEVAGELEEAGYSMARWEPMGPRPYDSGWAIGRAR